ncbi:MAG: helix-turn-helix transcriptional regulator [bacterium]|nr:helix-turn-helix transcriptional regulator [bacterium]
MNALQFTIVPPPEPLKGQVECFRIAKYNGLGPLSIHVTPKAVPGLVFQHYSRHSALTSITYNPERQHFMPTLFVYGAGVKPSIMNFSEAYTSIQVILKPHALPALLGINASLIHQGMALGVNEITRTHLDEQLLETDNQKQQIDLLTTFLTHLLTLNGSRDRVIEESLRLIHHDVARVSVAALLEALSISERQFERRFRQTVGVSPHAYIRVRRVNEAIRLIKHGQFRTLTEVAHHLHFYDQSHLIRDMQTFAGLSPKHVARNPVDFYHDPAGYSYLNK